MTVACFSGAIKLVMTSCAMQWRQIGPPLQDLLNGGDEFLASRVLQHVAGRARAQGCGGELGVGVHGQKDDFGVEACRFEPVQRLQPIHHRHGHVGDDDVRPEPLGGVDQRLPVAHGAHEVEIILQETGQPLRDNRVVISQQHSCVAHALPPAVFPHLHAVAPGPAARCHAVAL